MIQSSKQQPSSQVYTKEVEVCCINIRTGVLPPTLWCVFKNADKSFTNLTWFLYFKVLLQVFFQKQHFGKYKCLNIFNNFIHIKCLKSWYVSHNNVFDRNMINYLNFKQTFVWNIIIDQCRFCVWIVTWVMFIDPNRIIFITV